MKRVLLFLLLVAGQASAAEPVDLVWPWLDSANSRWFFFNSATRPFGMVNLSPDTEVNGAWGSGYRSDTPEVKVLSHEHAWQLSGLPVMPTSAGGSVGELLSDHASPFSHEGEVVRPGYHRLFLDRHGIGVELTATTRVGFHRYDYGDNERRRVVIPLSGPLGPVEIGGATLRQTGPRELEGSLVNEATRRRPRATPLFFVVRFDSDIADLQLAQDKAGALVDLAKSGGPG